MIFILRMSNNNSNGRGCNTIIHCQPNKESLTVLSYASDGKYTPFFRIYLPYSLATLFFNHFARWGSPLWKIS
jgi:hypothetical protein